jgi:GTP-binding protein
MTSSRDPGPPRVAVVGRQNVGKSTLVNRLLGRRETIAHEMPGVTRDRVELPVRWRGRAFRLVDTGGFTTHATGIEIDVAKQAALASNDADLILLVVDVHSGITEEDEVLASSLRRVRTPVLVVANKVDGESQEALAAEFHGLGLGDPVSISALHGRSSGELLDRILDLVPKEGEPPVEGEPRFALVGRPNVGKSSLFNKLVRSERVVVHERAGTTRDAVDSVVRYDGRPIRFIDTAGFRPVVRTRGVEYYGLLRAIRAIDAAHVAALVIDATEGLTGEDKRVAARVVEAGRGLVAVLNKWDLVPSGERADRFVELRQELQLFPGTPVIRTSALSGTGVQRVLPALLQVHASWSRRVATSDVNRVLEVAVMAFPPPRATGRILYGTQVSAGPPSFVLFGLASPPAAYRRYLENTLRREFGFDGVPVRLSFRARHPKPSGGRGGHAPAARGTSPKAARARSG